MPASPNPRTLQSRLIHLLEHWPTDRVRPASVSVQNYLQSRLPKNHNEPSQPPSVTSPSQPPATAGAGAGISESSVNALTSLLDNSYARRYPLPDKLRRPASNADHYDNVIREFDEAPDRDWVGRLRKRLGGLLRLR